MVGNGHVDKCRGDRGWLTHFFQYNCFGKSVSTNPGLPYYHGHHIFDFIHFQSIMNSFCLI